jgi:hypothetical protein
LSVYVPLVGFFIVLVVFTVDLVYGCITLNKDFAAVIDECQHEWVTVMFMVGSMILIFLLVFNFNLGNSSPFFVKNGILTGGRGNFTTLSTHVHRQVNEENFTWGQLILYFIILGGYSGCVVEAILGHDCGSVDAHTSLKTYVMVNGIAGIVVTAFLVLTLVLLVYQKCKKGRSLLCE